MDNREDETVRLNFVSDLLFDSAVVEVIACSYYGIFYTFCKELRQHFLVLAEILVAKDVAIVFKVGITYDLVLLFVFYVIDGALCKWTTTY